MKNLFRTGLLVAGLAPLLVVATPSAEADDGVCTVVGVMSLSSEFGDFTTNTADFELAATMGQCSASPFGLAMAGTVTGTCVNATATGTTNGGHDFTFTWAPKVIVFSGGVTGAFGFDENGFDGRSCTDETARTFTIAGTVTM